MDGITPQPCQIFYLIRMCSIAVACADSPKSFGIMLRVAEMDSGARLTELSLKWFVREYLMRHKRESER